MNSLHHQASTSWNKNSQQSFLAKLEDVLKLVSTCQDTVPQVPRNRESFVLERVVRVVEKSIFPTKKYLLEYHHFSVARKHISRKQPLTEEACIYNIQSKDLFSFIMCMVLLIQLMNTFVKNTL